MVETGALAYPVVMAAMIAVTRIGRQEHWESLEWLRIGTIALLLGLLVSVQVKLVMIGAADTPLAVAGFVVSLAGMTYLISVYLWERYQLVRGLARRDATMPSDA